MIWKRIMFSLAGVTAPTHVIDKLGRIVRASSAELFLFDGVYDSDLGAAVHGHTVEEAIRERVEQRRRALEAFADLLREQGLKVHTDVRWDYPSYEAIVRYVLRHKPDLLVMPTRRTQLTEQRALSYTDHRLIEACPCPLLLLKRHGGYSTGTVIAALDPEHAAADSGQLDEKILAAASTIARALSGATHLCHLMKPESPLAQPQSQAELRPLGTERSADAAKLIAMRERLRHFAALHDISDGQVHVQFGRVREVLPSVARELGAEVVVMGAVSRSVPARAIYTQTAEHLLEVLDCDVLVVKPSDFRCPVSQRPPTLAPFLSRRRRAQQLQVSS